MTYDLYLPEPGSFVASDVKLHDAVLGLDMEYTGGGIHSATAQLRLVQFATLDCAVTLDMMDPAQRGYAASVLRDSSRIFVAHNSAGAEIPATFNSFGLDISRRVFDTMTLALLCFPGETQGHGLKDFAEFIEDGAALLEAQAELKDEFLRIWREAGNKHGKDKDIQTYGWTNVHHRHPAYLKYAALDALIVRRLMFKLLEKAKFLQIPDHCTTFEQKVNAIAARMSGIRGQHIDMSRKDEILADVGVRNQTAMDAFQAKTGVLARSPKRVQVLADLGVKFKVWNPPNLQGERSPKLGKEELRELVLEYPYPEVQLLLNASETANATMFLKSLSGFVDARNRVHPNIYTLGAATGRWRVSTPATQTVSNKSGARNVFIPSTPDHVILTCDLGQIEPRVAFGLAEEWDMIELMQSGADAYSAAAELVFGEGYTVTERKLTKRMVLASLFEGGIDVIYRQSKYTDGWVDADKQLIAEARDEFRKSIPNVRAMTKKLQGEPDVRFDSGRFAPHESNPDFLYRSGNKLIQGTARDVLMQRYVAASDAGLDEMLLMCQHDEIQLDVPRAQLDEVAHTMNDIMTTGFMGVPTPCDLEVYDVHWGQKPRKLELT